MKENREQIRRMMITVNVINGIYQKIAKRIGIKENALSLLYALDDGKAHSQKEICEEWQIPKTTLNTIVKECVKKHLIILETNPNKKEKVIRLTENGHLFAEQILHQVYQIEQVAMKQTLQETSTNFVEGIELFAKHLKNNCFNAK